MTHGDADLVVAEAGPLELGDGLVGVAAVLEDSDDGRALLGCHVVLPMSMQDEWALAANPQSSDASTCAYRVPGRRCPDKGISFAGISPDGSSGPGRCDERRGPLHAIP